MTSTSGAPRTKLPAFARYAWFVLAYTVLVILWGAFVRATGSGAGCGEHWPLCNGSVLPRAPELATLIEFSHRLTSGLCLIVVGVLVVWAFRRFPKAHAARQGATLSMVFLVIEAAIGAGLVLLQLVADNDSGLRAVAVALHLVNTFILLGCITYTAWWASTGRSKPFKISAPLVQSVFIGVTVGVFLLVGASGAIVALGDTLFPATSLAEGFRQDVSETAHFLIRLRVLHPILAIGAAFAMLTLSAYLRLRIRTPRIARLSRALNALVLAQVAAGFINLALLAPVWLQMAHLLLADMLWTVLFILSLEGLVASPKKQQQQQQELTKTAAPVPKLANTSHV